MNIYNSITDVDLQFNNGYSKFTIMYGYIHDPIIDIQNCILYIIDTHNRIMDVNI